MAVSVPQVVLRNLQVDHIVVPGVDLEGIVPVEDLDSIDRGEVDSIDLEAVLGVVGSIGLEAALEVAGSIALVAVLAAVLGSTAGEDLVGARNRLAVDMASLAAGRSLEVPGSNLGRKAAVRMALGVYVNLSVKTNVSYCCLRCWPGGGPDGG